ncbi:hypothetical protein H6P81_017360 [Aristolochia fimbriata]|uniref:Uncharacterized protein n=1 Tax=Aristolochia fimbriata TaxID=158543 RepID=A0AAV7E0U0_ARIFI|nr:hypothetical protein H6P81_017360 [Aristolochia fimbriata]
MAADREIKLKLLVESWCNRVVFAECDSEFVDVLFSFLTMPMGSIIHLCGKETKMGCIDRLYQSVEELDERFFENEACKSMLLRPRSPSELKCANLAVNYNVAAPSTGYHLYACNCIYSKDPVSYYRGCQCRLCGGIMDHQLALRYPSGSSGVFVQQKKEFVVRDDLQVIPFVASETLSVMKKLGNTRNTVEERDVKIGSEEVLRLLKCSLHSQTALTDALLSNNIPITGQVKLKSDEKASDFVKNEQTNKGRRTMKRKLVMNRETKEVLHLEAREDLVNQILSFLTFPFGSVLKLMRGSAAGSPFLGSSVSNIYSAAEEFSTGGDNPFKSEESKTELVSPRLGCFMGCDDQLLIHHLVDEADSPPFYTVYCHAKYRSPCALDVIDTEPGYCRHSIKKVQKNAINPKLPNGGTAKGGGFMRTNTSCIITDDLSIKPLSSSTVFLVMNRYRLIVDEVEKQEISIGEEEAAAILRASMTSQTVLTDVFIRTGDKGKSFCTAGTLGA